MPAFNNEDWDKFDSDFYSYALARSTGTDEQDKDFQTYLQNQADDIVSTGLGSSFNKDSLKTKKSFDQLFRAGQDANVTSDELFPMYDDEWHATGESNVSEALLSMPGRARQELKDSTYRLARMQSWDYAAGQSIDRWVDKWIYKSEPVITPEEANAYAKAQGADLKFDHVISEKELEQGINAYKRREALQASQAQALSYMDTSRGVNTAILGSTLTGAIGPVELLGSTALAFIVPELSVKALAEGANIARTALTVKRVTDARRAVDTARNISNIVQAGHAAAKAGEAVSALSVFTKGTEGTKKFLAAEKAIVEADAALQKLGALSYEGLSGIEKTGLDTLTFLTSDVPFIQGTYSNSQKLGFELYSEKDKTMDTLMAAGLGVGLGGAFRAAGHFFGLTPTSLLRRRNRDLELTVKTKEALGEITPEKAAEIKAEIKKSNDALAAQEKAMKKQHPSLAKLADDIRRQNVSDEEYTAQKMIVINALMSGNRPKLSSIPELLSRLTHIDADVLRRVLTEPFENVFAPFLEKSGKEGAYSKVKISQETGLLGDASVGALDEAPALKQLENMYKGFYFKDQEALQAFSKYVDGFSKFVRRLQEIQEDYSTKFLANKQAKKKGERRAYGKAELLDLRKEIRQAYLELEEASSSDIAGLAEKAYANDLRKQFGEEAEAYTEAELAALKRADDFVAKHVQVTDKGFQNLINAKGKSDGGWAFKGYLNSLAELAEGNEKLARTDDYLSMISQERVGEILESLRKFDVSPDTDFNHLFNEPRVSSKEFEKQNESSVFWNSRLSLSRLQHAALMKSPQFKKAINFLKNLSVTDKTKDSYFNRALGVIDSIREWKAKGFNEIREASVEKLRAEIAYFAKRYSFSFAPDIARADMREDVRWVLKNSFKDLGLDKLVDNVDEIVSSAARRFDKLLEEHPEYAEFFTTKEEIAQKYQKEYEKSWDALGKETRNKAQEEGTGITKQVDEGSFQKIVEEKIYKPAFKQQEIFNKIFDAVEEDVDIYLSRVEMQKMHDVSVMTKAFQAMIEHPEEAGEILESLSTQSHGMHFGSGNSVEYMSKSATLYVNDVKNTLMEMESGTNGVSLLDRFMSKDVEFQNAVKESLVRRRWDQKTKNADADRIAEVIDNARATLLSGLRRFGSNFQGRRASIDISKLKNMDAFLSDSAENAIWDKVFSEQNALSKNVQASLARLSGQLNTTNRKIVAIVFRDADLDQMFNPHGTAYISLNEARDALLNGNFEEFIRKYGAGDVENDAMEKDLKSLVATLVGAIEKQRGGVYQETSSGYRASGKSWVMAFRSGFSDIGAAITGRKAAALDALEHGIIFKDADSEVAFTKMLGYDTAQKQMISEFNSLRRAHFTLNNYGTNPHAMVEELIDTYEKTRKTGDYRDFLMERYKKSIKGKEGQDVENTLAENIGERYAITTNKKTEILDMVDLACGLQNASPSSVTRVIKSICKMISSGLLAKAGFKSGADYATIVEGLLTNGLVTNAQIKGRGEAIGVIAEASKFLSLPQNRDIRDLVVAGSILDRDDIAKKMTNDPSMTMLKLKEQMTMVDKTEALANKISNFALNTIGFMEPITNNNKRKAGLACQFAIGSASNKTWEMLGPRLQFFLERSGIDEADWDFIRKSMTVNFNDYVNKLSGTSFVSSGQRAFMPMLIRDISDKTLIKELEKRGVQNITQDIVDEFRMDIAGKAWSMIDAASDEMVSIPSARIQYYMRGGQAKNSRIGTVAEIVTQFQSFAASLTYSTYGRRLQSLAAEAMKSGKATGITMFDVLTGNAAGVDSLEVFGDLFMMVLGIGLTNIAISTAVNAAAGQIRKPTDTADVLEMAGTEFANAMGIAGPVVNAVFDGMENAGLRGGGFNIQVAPAASTLVRSGYRLTRPIQSQSVTNKGSAFAAGVANEVARYSGIKAAPIIGPVFQALVGSYLDMIYTGGPAEYYTKQNRLEKQGKVIMPWETGEPLGGLLQ